MFAYIYVFNFSGSNYLRSLQGIPIEKSIMDMNLLNLCGNPFYRGKIAHSLVSIGFSIILRNLNKTGSRLRFTGSVANR